MDFLVDGSLGAGALFVLIVALLFALSFEFVNGFHDTANAVATVIYTHSLTPTQAVIWSGTWNFLGVLTSSGAVAFGIVALLPIELILHVGSEAGFAMIFALLLSAIIWNVGTWYLGLPASSSHTLIGSIVGVGITNSLMAGDGFGEGVNWGKLDETIIALVTSPIIGFVAAAVLLVLAKALIRNPALYRSPEGKAPPPPWIRALLVLTCTGVSFAHGSNDGQKGMGLIMLVLIGLVPASFALRLSTPESQLQAILVASQAAQPILDKAPSIGPLDSVIADRDLSHFLTTGTPDATTLPCLAFKNARITTAMGRMKSIGDLTTGQRSRLRRDVYLVDGSIAKLIKIGAVSGKEAAQLQQLRRELLPLTDYIPVWVKVAVAVALGLGTMVGWKRIVVTIGEKIGKSHLTYAQGASAELVTMSTIGLADVMGVPVSTTHILSSGIAGAMFANHSGLQKETLRNIMLAWVLTVPVCMVLGSVLFASSLYVILRLFG
ncbi:MAG: inorganic phosphate transporter [Reyranellales bacterium]